MGLTRNRERERSEKSTSRERKPLVIDVMKRNEIPSSNQRTRDDIKSLINFIKSLKEIN